MSSHVHSHPTSKTYHAMTEQQHQQNLEEAIHRVNKAILKYPKDRFLQGWYNELRLIRAEYDTSLSTVLSILEERLDELEEYGVSV